MKSMREGRFTMFRGLRRTGLVLVAIVCTAVVSVQGATVTFDGDANADVVFSLDFGNGGQLDWVEYNPDTGLGVTRTITGYVGRRFSAVTFANLDGDANADLLAVGTQGVEWYEARSDNTISLVNRWDLANANYQDIKVLGGKVYATRDGAVELIRATGDNVATITPIITNSSITYRSIAGGDYDNDGKDELVVGWNWKSNPGAGQIDKYEMNNDTAQWKGTVVSLPGSNEFATGDIDGDGNLDMIISQGLASGQIWWAEGNGVDNGLELRHLIYRTADHALIADIDQDGKGDVLTSEINNGEQTAWREGTADNTIAMVKAINSYHKSGALAVGDWDGDSKIDVLFGSKSGIYGVQKVGVVGDNVLGTIGAFNSIQLINDAEMMDSFTIPEPGTMALLSAGGLMLVRCKRK